MRFKISLVLCAWITPVSLAHASNVAGQVNKANALYNKAKFDEALKVYENALTKDPQSASVQYNLGTALYKKGDYAQAAEHLQKSLLSDDPQLQKNAQYNLGNTLYKNGVTKEKSNLDAAIDDLKNALTHYEKNLAVLPKDADAQNNYEFVQKELERLKQKKKEQDQQKQSQKDQSQQSQNDGQKDQGDQKQNKDPSSQDPKDQPSDQNQNKNPEKGDEQNKNSGQNDQDKDQNKSSSSGEQDKNDRKDTPSGAKPEAENPQGPSDQTPSPASGNGEQGFMTPQEAQMLLDDYQRNDEPKGMLYFKNEEAQSRPVDKDW